MTMTVTRLARACGLSRSTVLYYESVGLLRPPRRSAGNYRVYSEKDLERLRQVRAYRASGLEIADIRSILDCPLNDAAKVLRRRLAELGADIERLRGHQLAIARLLKNTSQFRRIAVITKDKWVAIMKGAGFSAEDMHRWHAEFEKSSPNEHQEFLEFLHIPTVEIAKIRDASRAAGKA
jgi:DNA-binding transcriptional MerR regulator